MFSTDKGLTKEQLVVKKQWQDAHQSMIKAMDDGDKSEADRLDAVCKSLLPKFSKYAARKN